MPHPETSDPTLVGAVLSRRFRLQKKVGEGGMGAVYTTDQVIDGRKAAVKVLHPEFVHEPEVKARFAEEARTCQRLVHPNVLRVFESAEAEDGTPYIVMELLEGVPLSAYTENGGRVPLAQAVVIAQGILAGLAAAHAQGIVHRDLKPENVFLANEGHGTFVVKLLDFGIAKVMDAAGGMGSKTRTGMLLGTPAYMSPEQIKNSKDVDPRSDLWSVGVMLYEMLTGRTAFPAPTEYARLFAVLNNVPEPIEQIDPQLGSVGPFMLRALEKDRGARFQSALEMAHALTRAAGHADPKSRAMPLSRLPEVGSLFAPAPTAPTGAASPLASSTFLPAPPTQIPATAAIGPNGTLTSPARSDVIITSAPAPAVSIASSVTGGTLPSNDLPMLESVSHGVSRLRTGVDVRLVLVIVLVALLAGFALGFALGRAAGG